MPKSFKAGQAVAVEQKRPKDSHVMGLKLAAIAVVFCSQSPADCSNPNPFPVVYSFIQAHKGEYAPEIVEPGWETGAEASRTAKTMCGQILTAGDATHIDTDPVLFAEETYTDGHSSDIFVCRLRDDLIS
jgi:hypothetical protein